MKANHIKLLVVLICATSAYDFFYSSEGIIRAVDVLIVVAGVMSFIAKKYSVPAFYLLSSAFVLKFLIKNFMS